MLDSLICTVEAWKAALLADSSHMKTRPQVAWQQPCTKDLVADLCYEPGVAVLNDGPGKVLYYGPGSSLYYGPGVAVTTDLVGRSSTLWVW
jgi:hypothetical protein